MGRVVVNERNQSAPAETAVDDLGPPLKVSYVAEDVWSSRYWNGRAPLWKAFWLVGVLGQVLVLLGIGLASWVLRPILSALLIYGFAVLALMAMSVFASVSVWRCAVNAKQPPLGGLARVVVAFYVFAWLLLIIRVNSMGSGV